MCVRFAPRAQENATDKLEGQGAPRSYTGIEPEFMRWLKARRPDGGIVPCDDSR